MTYNPAIPAPNDDISQSQGDLLINFGQLNTVYGTDHVAFDAAANRGYHNAVTFVSQGADPIVDAPETEVNEIALYSITSAAKTEIYAREQNNGDVNQITKNGSLYIGMHPVFAINISDLAPNANTAAGAYNFTVNSSFNFNAAASSRSVASRCEYTFVFTDPVLDAAGNPTNKYMFVANGFDSTVLPVVGKVPNTNNYNAVVTSTSIQIQFAQYTNAVTQTLTGASIICWRVQ